MFSVYSLARRWLSTLILALWMAPNAAILMLCLHVTLDHYSHGHDKTGHQFDVADLAAAMLHGHHHDAETTEDHKHEAVFERAAGFLSPRFALARADLPLGATEVSSVNQAWSHGPPFPVLQPLPFATNCSLLL